MFEIREPRTTAAALAAALLAALPAPRAAAQAGIRPAYTVSAGLSQYDLSGTGTAPAFAFRADLPLTSALLVEGGLGLSLPSQAVGPTGDETTKLFVPEVGLQLQLPRRFAPYLGVGAGVAIDYARERADGTRSDLTLSGAGGVRAWLTDRMGLRGELRVRGVGTGFEGAAAEWTLGVSWRP